MNNRRPSRALLICRRVPTPTLSRVPPNRVPRRARYCHRRVVYHKRPVSRCRPGLRIVGKTGAGDVVTVVVTSVGESGHETARAREKGANGREAGGEKPVALATALHCFLLSAIIEISTWVRIIEISTC